VLKIWLIGKHEQLENVQQVRDDENQTHHVIVCQNAMKIGRREFTKRTTRFDIFEIQHFTRKSHRQTAASYIPKHRNIMEISLANVVLYKYTRK